MASVNKVILIGNLGKDPEVRYLPGGRAVANVTLATSESWTDKTTGERQERTEWHHAVFYSPLAEIAGQYLRKGSQVFVEGRLQTRKWQDKNGQDRYTTEIVASEMKMLGGRAATGAAAPFSSEGDAGPAPPSAPQPHPPPAAPRAPARSRRASPPAPAPAVAAAPDGGRWDEDDIPFVRPTALDGLPW